MLHETLYEGCRNVNVCFGDVDGRDVMLWSQGPGLWCEVSRQKRNVSCLRMTYYSQGSESIFNSF